MTDFREPDETDIGRFCVALCATYDEPSEFVLDVIRAELAEWPKFLHAAILTATLRTIVAHYYGTLARRIEREDPGCITTALRGQAAENEGMPWVG